MLVPNSKSHSISRVIANLYIPQNIIKPDILFKKIIQSEALKDYHKRNVTNTKTININNEGLNLSQNESNGFIFEEFDKIGKSINILKVENISNKAQINFENREYTSWNSFRKRLFEEIKILSDIFDIYIEAIGLTYVDEFSWDSQEPINIKEVFDENSEILNTNFIESYNGTLVLISQSDKKDRIQFDEEKTEVLFNNNFKRIIVNHTFAIKLSEITLYNAEENDFFSECFERAHKANKDLLKKIFTKSVQELIDLK